ncbi:MAG: helix-turn-helix transcriptional regulator [Propionibacteriaceae bacterium]|jgi:transcriptional regulator with XRE-family HTH domain|nr:helix-turn-helix transcriptional regulator [Propionibacteriaceae bacterium]
MEKTVKAARSIGAHLRTWRKMLSLPVLVVAERARVSRSTVQRLEAGDLGVSIGSVLAVAAGLGILDSIVDSTDPMNTDFGRAQLANRLPQRVRVV